MNAALMYCNNEFERAHEQTRKNKAIFEAFETLATEIKKLDYMQQINLYSVTTQFLESLVKNQGDVINPLDVFILRSDSIVNENQGYLRTIGLLLGVTAISLSVVILGASIGFGVGVLLGLWQTPLIFMAALMAAEPAALIVASVSVAAGAVTGLVSKFLFFRESSIKKALDNSVEEIKKSYLSATFVSANDESMELEKQDFVTEPEEVASHHSISGLG